MTISTHLDTFLWALINLEVEMISLERLAHYLHGIDQEADPSLRATLHTIWPSEGNLFSDVTVTYAQRDTPSLQGF